MNYINKTIVISPAQGVPRRPLKRKLVVWIQLYKRDFLLQN